MKKTSGNIVIFGLATLASGFLGHAINLLLPPSDPMQSLGVLVWLVTPLAVSLLLRSVGKDGWHDFGLRPHFRTGWLWYLVSLAIFPVSTLAVVGIGSLLGFAAVSGSSAQGWRAFFTLFFAAFAGSAVKNVFEEFAWRGYLTPMLERIQPNPILMSLVTGVIWASWHISYYLFFLDPMILREQTTYNAQTLILLSFLMLPLQAFAYGELRLISKSVWPAWLLHNLANAVEFSLITSGVAVISGKIGATFLIPYSFALGLIGWGLYSRRMQLSREPNAHKEALHV